MEDQQQDANEGGAAMVDENPIILHRDGGNHGVSGFYWRDGSKPRECYGTFAEAMEMAKAAE